MKRIISFALTAIMLLSTMVFSTSADGSLIFSDYFDSGFMPRNWIQDGESCAFEWDKYNQCIHGYDKAVVLQSNYGTKYDRWWSQFYASFDVQVRGFDDLPEQEGRSHYIGMWYRDRMENDPEKGGDQQGAVYNYSICVETGEVTLKKEHNWSYKDEYGVTQKTSTDAVIATATLPEAIEVAEDAEWFEMGMRVETGKITCYYNQQAIITAEVDPADTKYGDFTQNSVDESVGSQKSAILFINTGNWIALDNFEVWTPDYNFEEVAYGDVNGDEEINASDVSLILQIIAGWNLTDISAGAANVNGDGTVDLLDVTKLLRYVAGWEDVVLGPSK